MCEKCDTLRERINKFLAEDEVMAQDPDHALASFAAVAVEKVLDKADKDPYRAAEVLKRLLAVAVGRQLQQMLKDPKVQAELEELKQGLQDRLQAEVLQNMPEPKQVH